MSTAAAVMIIKAPTTAAPIIVRPASVLNHFWVPGSGLSVIIALIHPLVPSGSPVHHPVLHLPPRADRTAVCGSPRFGRLRFRLLPARTAPTPNGAIEAAQRCCHCARDRDRRVGACVVVGRRRGCHA